MRRSQGRSNEEARSTEGSEGDRSGGKEGQGARGSAGGLEGQKFGLTPGEGLLWVLSCEVTCLRAESSLWLLAEPLLNHRKEQRAGAGRKT